MAFGHVEWDRYECAICSEPYSTDIIPKILPCIHTFCHVCLSQLAKQSQEQRSGLADITCPSCRRVSPVPDGGVDNLQTNFYIDTIRGGDKLAELREEIISLRSKVRHLKKRQEADENSFQNMLAVWRAELEEVTQLVRGQGTALTDQLQQVNQRLGSDFSQLKRELATCSRNLFALYVLIGAILIIIVCCFFIYMRL